jgi:hypothetical protein
VLHDDRVLLAEIASVNRELVRFSCEVIDEMAGDERPASTRTQRDLGERLIALGEALIERDRHPVLPSPSGDDAATPGEDDENADPDPPGAGNTAPPADALIITGSA